MSFVIHDKCRISDKCSAVTTGEEYQIIEMLEVKKSVEFKVGKRLAINQERNVR
jgi:hypothetical protein